MSLDRLKKRTNWTSRPFARPLEIEDKLFITVATTDRSFANRSEFNAIMGRARETGLRFLLQYFAFEEDPEYIDCALSDGIVRDEDYYIDPRPGSRVFVHVSVEREPFFDLFSTVPRPDIDSRVDITMEFTRGGLRQFCRRVVDRLELMEESLPKFIEGGSVDWPSITGNPLATGVGIGDVVGFSLQKDKENILKFAADIEELYVENQKYGRTNRAGTFRINFDEAYEMVSVESGSDRDGYTQMRVSFNNYLQKRYIAERRTLSFLYNVYRDEDTYFDRSTTWDTIFSEFFFPPISYNAFFDSHLNRLNRGFDDMADALLPEEVQGVLGRTFQKAEENGALDFDMKLKLRERREGEVGFVGDDVFYDIDVITPTLSTIEDCFDEFLDKIDPKDILETILACLPFGIGFELPTINWPNFSFPKLPVLDFLIFIRIDLEELLRLLIKELLKLLIDFLMDLLMRFCEMLMDPFGTNPHAGYVTDLEDFYDDRGGTVVPVTDIAEEQGKNTNPPNADILRQFMRDVFARLTPIQICNLLRGIPDSDALEQIEDVLNEEGNEALRAFFVNEIDVQRFFRNVGIVIGDAALFRLCSLESIPPADPCSAEDATKAVYRNLLAIKRLNGEEVPEEFEEEIIEKYGALREAFAEGIQEIASSENYFEVVKDDLFGSFNDFVPGDSLSDEVSLASEQVVDGVYDSADMFFRDGLGRLWGELVENLTINSSPPDALEKRELLKASFLSSEVPDLPGYLPLAVHTLGSIYFTAPGFELAMGAGIDNSEPIEDLGFDEQRKSAKMELRGASINKISSALDGGFTPLETSLALGMYKYALAIEAYRFLCEACPLTCSVEPLDVLTGRVREYIFNQVESSVDDPEALNKALCFFDDIEEGEEEIFEKVASFFRAQIPSNDLKSISSLSTTTGVDISVLRSNLDGFAIYTRQEFVDAMGAGDGYEFFSPLSSARAQVLSVLNGALKVMSGG